MVHKSDLSWTVKVNNPADLYHKGDDVEAIILSINHDEKKVSLGIKQLFDDPWPSIFNEFPPGQASSTTRSSRIVDYGVFVRIRDGVEGLIPSNEIVREEERGRRGRPFEIGDAIQAEIANIDSQDCRLTLSMRIGEARLDEASAEKRQSVAPKGKSAGGDDGGKATSIGELIKQKLGEKLMARTRRAPTRRKTPTSSRARKTRRTSPRRRTRARFRGADLHGLHPHAAAARESAPPLAFCARRGAIVRAR